MTSFEHGRTLYNTYCYFCHGYSGDAKTLASTYLDPPPLNFASSLSGQLSRDRMFDSVRNGRPGTAMMSFAGQLSDDDIAAVIDFIREAFIKGLDSNTYYHTPENGWDDHQRYAAAFPFALGEIALDIPWDELTEDQRRGKQLFMSACITCHDRAEVKDNGAIWDPRAVSYPRSGFDHRHQEIDARSGATLYARHDQAPALTGLSKQEQLGESLFQDNCAFCHAADGSGRNWIGSFLEPHPRDLTNPVTRAGMTHDRLRTAIESGLPGTTMPAWKSILDEDEIDAIIAYISRAFHLPEQSQDSR